MRNKTLRLQVSRTFYRSLLYTQGLCPLMWDFLFSTFPVGDQHDRADDDRGA